MTDKTTDFDPTRGIDIGQLLSGTIPEPTKILEWGKDIPPETMQALRDGETATLNDAEGKPHSTILMDHYGTIRERQI